MRDNTREKSEGGSGRYKGLGRELAKLRKETGLTQHEWAKLVGANRSQIAAWETGVKKPSVERFISMANVANKPALASRFLALAGLDPIVLQGLARGEAGLPQTKIAKARKPKPGSVIQVPVVRDFAEGFRDDNRTFSLPAARFSDPDRFAVVEYRRRQFPSFLGQGDLAIIDVSRRSPLELLGRLILLSLDPFPEGYAFGPAASAYHVARRQAIPVVHLDAEELQHILRAPTLPEEEAEYKRVTAAGYLAGWLTIHYASRERDQSRRAASDPWKLVLQLTSNETYEGSAIDLTGWKTTNDPERDNPAPVSLLKELQIVGEIVGWIAARSNASAGSGTNSKQEQR